MDTSRGAGPEANRADGLTWKDWPDAGIYRFKKDKAHQACRRQRHRCYHEGVLVVLRKLGRGSRAVSGRLVRAPRKGSVIVIEFSDGLHEYVTTPVKRVLRVVGLDVFFIETANSRYRLEIRGREQSLEGASSG